VLIFGAISGKNIAEMARLLAAHFEHIIISTPGTFKESSPSEMLTIFHALNPHTVLEPNPERALQRAFQVSRNSRPILVTGSFFMIAEIRKFLI
jgi:folylpolyglutamate synthase/dihydropteroate synthase